MVDKEETASLMSMQEWMEGGHCYLAHKSTCAWKCGPRELHGKRGNPSSCIQ